MSQNKNGFIFILLVSQISVISCTKVSFENSQQSLKAQALMQQGVFDSSVAATTTQTENSSSLSTDPSIPDSSNVSTQTGTVTPIKTPVVTPPVVIPVITPVVTPVVIPTNNNQTGKLPSTTTNLPNVVLSSDAGNSTQQPAVLMGTVNSNAPIHVDFDCSTGSSIANQGNIISSTAPLTISISGPPTTPNLEKGIVANTSQDRVTLCTYTDTSIKEFILANHQIPIPASCPSFKNAGELYIQLFESTKPNQNLIHPTIFYSHTNSPSNPMSLGVLLDANSESSYIGYGYNENTTDSYSCERRASPLFIDVGGESSSEKLVTTSPRNGIQFDILGNSNKMTTKPNNHKKDQISWFRSKNFMFLVKPIENPKDGIAVRGIDQLFGDNTELNSTIKYASDGFKALAYYDKNDLDPKDKSYGVGDGMIDNKDAIFSKLRLWSDDNGDGLGQENELHSLDEFDIVAISVRPNLNYQERDIWGNQIKGKASVIGKSINGQPGAVKLMFDMWFKL